MGAGRRDAVVRKRRSRANGPEATLRKRRSRSYKAPDIRESRALSAALRDAQRQANPGGTAMRPAPRRTATGMAKRRFLALMHRER